MLFHHRVRSVAAALTFLLTPAAVCAQGGYVFTKIIDDQTPRPDGQGTFYIGFPSVSPSLDGNTVLFQDIANSANSLWTASASGGGAGLVKIADFATAVPGGVGTFTRFDDQTARVQDGVILFEGLDSNTTVRTHGGLYTVPAAGGAISRVFDYQTTAPGSTDTFIQPNGNNQITDGPGEGDYDFEGGVVAFHAITESNADGIYTVHLDGTGLTLLANRSTPATGPTFPANQYYTVALHDGTAVFYGATVFGPYGVFSSPETGGLTAPSGLASPSTALPGGQSPEMSTVYFTGFGRFDHVTGTFTFAAHDGSGVNGLYALPFGSLGGGTIAKVVDNRTALPGTTVPASYFDGTPFSADGGQVAFVTADDQSAGQVGALYVANADGSISRVIGIGDMLDGIALTGIDLGAHALSGGRIAFGAGSYLQGHDGNARYGAIFVATPLALSADLALTLAASASTVSPGQPVTYTLGVVNNGPAAAPAVSVVDTLPAGVTFVSATGGAAAVNGVVTFGAGDLGAGASASFQVIVQPAAAGALVNAATAMSATADPDTGNNTAQATVTAAAAPRLSVTAPSSHTKESGGSPGVFKIKRKGDLSAPLTIKVALKGSAVNGVDYAALGKKVTFAAGAGAVKLKVFAIDRDASGAAKAVTLKLKTSADGAYTLGSAISATVTIDRDR